MTAPIKGEHAASIQIPYLDAAGSVRMGTYKAIDGLTAVLDPLDSHRMSITHQKYDAVVSALKALPKKFQDRLRQDAEHYIRGTKPAISPPQDLAYEDALAASGIDADPTTFAIICDHNAGGTLRHMPVYKVGAGKVAGALLSPETATFYEGGNRHKAKALDDIIKHDEPNHKIAKLLGVTEEAAEKVRHHWHSGIEHGQIAATPQAARSSLKNIAAKDPSTQPNEPSTAQPSTPRQKLQL